MIIRSTLILFLYLLTVFTFCYSQTHKETYSCKPCGLACDSLIFDGPGQCPNCTMNLVTNESLHKFDNLVVNEINIEKGSGEFIIEGGGSHQEKTIRIFYYKPGNFAPDSPILLVIPGSGRDGDEYRDSWIEASEKHGVLILSPSYAEKDYDFGGYHLGGLLYDSNLENCVTYRENSNLVELDEAKFTYSINSNPEEWIFNDFDRLFDQVVLAVGSSQTRYDIFGHSAGGQILHRLPLFHPLSKANRILASNSAFYTLPDSDLTFPFGVKNTPIDNPHLKPSFKTRLVLFLGELDNENENGGLLLRSPTADKQGLHRLERGKYFFKEGQKIASKMDTPFNWKIAIIPGVGHDFRKMGKAAAAYLYENTEVKSR